MGLIDQRVLTNQFDNSHKKHRNCRLQPTERQFSTLGWLCCGWNRASHDPNYQHRAARSPDAEAGNAFEMSEMKGTPACYRKTESEPGWVFPGYGDGMATE